MNDSERGKIRNREHVPVKDFSGLRYGKITPTDIDGFVEFKDKIFILLELKFGDSVLKYGQRTALERGCDAWGEQGKQRLFWLPGIAARDRRRSMLHPFLYLNFA